MRTFPSYDYMLCGQEDCKRKEECVRYLTYQKAKRVKYPYMISVFRPKETPQDCTYHEPAGEEEDYERGVCNI